MGDVAALVALVAAFVIGIVFGALVMALLADIAEASVGTVTSLSGIVGGYP